MPELPEVETLKRELAKALPGRQIKSVEVLWWKTVSPLSPEEFAKQMAGKKIVDISRRAKMLFINFADTTALAVHLKMTGQLIFEPKKGRAIGGGHPDQALAEKQPTKHTRLIFEFKDDSKLYFNDLRKFGWVRLVTDQQMKQLIKPYGLEPLSKIFTDQALTDIFKHHPKRSIKKILLDQSLIAGLGNIYVDESCFQARLLPTKQALNLKPADLKRLRLAIIRILKFSIHHKGTSSKNYRRSNGSPGGFVPHLKVYGRENKPCKICGHPIQKITHASRGTHFCQHCQK
ncbi:MAG: bifunctional DNA-formamidopyrimidine glycosylase/DNA-(apurinic or apyrimidinic site) lyase [Candidatus Paceibacterota bacterium]|jgi:formamidopyrimidine-DNA glycosylase